MKTEDKPHVTAQLAALRHRAGLSMQALANALGYKTASGYQRYEDANIYKRPALPLHLLKPLSRALVGKGNPRIRPEDLLPLFGIEQHPGFFTFSGVEVEGNSTNDDLANAVDFVQEIPDQLADELPFSVLRRRHVQPRPQSAPAPTGHIPSNVKGFPATQQVEIPAVGGWARDVPVLGVTQGGPGNADFSLNIGEPIDWVRRPPRFTGVHIFALYVAGDSMSPWREDGDLVYVHPGRHGRPGDYVVVECFPKAPGEPPPAFLKKLVKVTGLTVVLQQYNPPIQDLAVPRDAVKGIHRVLDWNELLAV